IRRKYDNTIKEYEILENKEKYLVYRILLHSPIFFISERDFVDKRIEFVHENVYYNFASSVENNEPNSKAVRMKTYLNLLILSQDDSNFYFECYSQYDAK